MELLLECMTSATDWLNNNLIKIFFKIFSRLQDRETFLKKIKNQDEDHFLN